MNYLQTANGMEWFGISYYGQMMSDNGWQFDYTLLIFTFYTLTVFTRRFEVFSPKTKLIASIMFDLPAQ